MAGGNIFTPNPQCLRQVDCALYIMYITVTLFMRLKDGHQGHFVDKKSATYNVSQSKSKPPFCAYLEGKITISRNVSFPMGKYPPLLVSYQ